MSRSASSSSRCGGGGGAAGGSSAGVVTRVDFGGLLGLLGFFAADFFALAFGFAAFPLVFTTCRPYKITLSIWAYWGSRLVDS